MDKELESVLINGLKTMRDTIQIQYDERKRNVSNGLIIVDSKISDGEIEKQLAEIELLLKQYEK